MTALDFVMYICIIVRMKQLMHLSNTKNEVENQLNLKIKMIRSDRGGEYEYPFAEIYLKYGIVLQITAPYAPQSNGLEERKNKTLKEMMNALRINSSSPQNVWVGVILTCNKILNRVPH